MRILTEPARLDKLLKTVLIHKQKSLLDTIIGEFTPKGVVFKDMKLEVAAIHAVYSPKYFLEYESVDSENVPLTASLMDMLGQGFKDEKVTLMTSEGHLVLKGSKETYNELLTEAEKGEFVIKLQNTDFGFVPEKEPTVRVLLNVEDLNLPTAEKYRFDCDGKDLSVSIKDIGEYTKTFKPSKAPTLGELNVTFDGSFFQQMMSNMTGEVWVSMTEGGVVFSQKTKDFCLTYLLSSLSEE